MNNMLKVTADDPKYKDIFRRQTLTVLPADHPLNHPIGWKVYETVGVAVHNTWMFKPWWKKIWHKRFWKDLFMRHKNGTCTPL
jgi:hypothetical protein